MVINFIRLQRGAHCVTSVLPVFEVASPNDDPIISHLPDG